MVADRALPTALTLSDVDQAFDHEVAELLMSLAEQSSVALPPEAVVQLAALSMRSENRSAIAEKALREVAEVAGQTGCKYAVFKGPANAATLYSDRAQRPFNDVDILVGFDGTDGLEDFLVALGRDRRSASALVTLAKTGTPIHEVSLRVAGADIDVHFNPFGLVVPVRDPAALAKHLADSFKLGSNTYRSASPELSLLISSVNLIRKGGGALWVVADMARLIHGRAGHIDWDKFGLLAEAEGLGPIAGQALRLMHDDVGVEVPAEMRAERRSWWAPELAEGAATLGVLRRATFSILHRDPVKPIEAVPALLRWYVPNRIRRVARSTEGSGSVLAQGDRVVSGLRTYYKKVL